MSRPNVKTNFIFQTAYQLLILVVPLVTAPYLSRVLGSSAIGAQTLSFNVSNYFVLFSMLGLAKYGLRCVSEEKHDREKCSNVFTELFLIHLLFSVVGTILYVLYVLLFVRDDVNLYWLSIIYVVGTIFDVNWVFFGLEKFKITVIRNLFVKVFSTILIFLLVKKVEDLWIYVLILALSQFISYAFLWPSLLKELHFTKINLKIAFRKHFKNLLLLFVPVIAISIYKSMDKVMVGFMSGNEQLGYYESADKIIVIALAIIGSLGTVILPKLASVRSTGNQAEYDKIVRASSFFNSFLTCGCMFGLLGVAQTLVPVFYGEAFSPSVSILLILCSTILFSSLSDFVRMSFLIPQKKDKAYVICVLIGVGVNFILNFPLIHFLGANGAALSTAITELVVCVSQYFFCRGYFRFKSFLANWLPFMAIGGITFCTAFFSSRLVPYGMLRLVVQILIGFLTYVLLSFVFIFFFKRNYFSVIFHRRQKDEENSSDGGLQA